MKKSKKLSKLTDKEWEIAHILVDEIHRWESTTKVSLEEFIHLVKRLTPISR